MYNLSGSRNTVSLVRFRSVLFCLGIQMKSHKMFRMKSQSDEIGNKSCSSLASVNTLIITLVVHCVEETNKYRGLGQGGSNTDLLGWGNYA